MQSAEAKHITLVNGRETAEVSIFDRGLQYGHGLFETIAVKQGQLEHWDLHVARLVDGCLKLSIPTPDLSLLHNEAMSLATSVTDKAVLKIIYSCGVGGRGYKTPHQTSPTRILSLSEWPDYPIDNKTSGVTLRLCDTRLGINSTLAGIKHLNRLEQVLARSEWDDETIAEGLMLDHQGLVREGTMSNVFFVKDQTLCTPDLTHCGVAGVMRSVVLKAAETLQIRSYIDDFTPDDIFQADELFISNSVIGIWPVKAIQFKDAVAFGHDNIITKKLMEKVGDL